MSYLEQKSAYLHIRGWISPYWQSTLHSAILPFPRLIASQHRDNKENRVIASVSLGAERDFIMQHDEWTKGHDLTSEGERMKKRWPLKSGSLLIMQGETQQFWKHEIVRCLLVYSVLP